MKRLGTNTCSVLLVLVLCQVRPALAEERSPLPETANLVVTGLLVCLDGSFKDKVCGTTPETLGLKVTGGKIYPLKKHENVDALFVEKRLQTREFRLTLRKDEKSSPWYELVKSQLVRGGKIYNFDYFCDICNITTHAPGICLCCRESTEYRERPAE